MNKNDILNELCAMSQKMERLGLVGGTAGNISRRLPEEKLVAITPSGIPYERYAPELMCIVDMDGNMVEGSVQPSTETPLHTMLHKHLPGDHAIVHTHSPYVTTFAVLGQSIPVLGLEGLLFGAPEILCTDGFITPGSPMLGEAVIKTLDRQPGAKAVLLQNHGLVAIGDSIEAALNLANSIEFTARLYYQTLCIGKPNILTGEQITKQLRYYADLKAGTV